MSVRRRHFILGAVGASVLAGCGRWPWQGSAQRPPSGTPARTVGLLTGSSPNTVAPYLEAFRQSLRDLGRVEGQEIVIEARYGDGVSERLPDLAAQLVALPSDVMLVQGTPAVLAAREASATVPIAFVEVGNPVGTGLVASLARPGGQATGLAGFGPDLAAKRLELLAAAIPAISRVAVLRSPSPANEIELTDTQHAAQLLGLRLQVFDLPNMIGLDGAFVEMARDPPDALLLLSSSGVPGYQDKLIELSTRSGLPAMAWKREFAIAGGLMAYGPSTREMWSRVAYYVDRILKGTRPADLPVEQPMTFEFVVNLKTARELGIIFPNEIMLQVTEVID